MKFKIISKRYAEAFFKAIQEDDFEEGFRDFEAFMALWYGYDGLADILKHPTIHYHRKVKLIKNIFGERAQKNVTDFICLLVKRKRINLMEKIALEVERLYRRTKGIRGIMVKSAVPLIPEERKRLQKLLSEKFGLIEIREIVDPKILGGLIVYFSDQVIDNSVQARLRKLNDLMIRVDNEWLATLISQPTLAL